MLSIDVDDLLRTYIQYHIKIKCKLTTLLGVQNITKVDIFNNVFPSEL